MRHIPLLLLVLLAVAVIGIGFAARLSAPGPEVIKYEKEWVTTLLQACLIAVPGAVTATVVELFKSGLQQEKDRNKLRLDAHSELCSHYQNVKHIRRTYQASKTLTVADTLELNEIQLALESLRDDSSTLFGRSTGEVFDGLYGLERYLYHLANNPTSNERLNFEYSKPPENSFKVFSLVYSSASSAMRLEIAPPPLMSRIRRAVRRPKNEV